MIATRAVPVGPDQRAVMWQLAAQVAQHATTPHTAHLSLLILVCTPQAGLAWMPQALEWTQTALYKDGTTDLLKSMPPLVFMPMPDKPDGSPFLSIDASTSYQEILGFGGESSRLHARPSCSPSTLVLHARPPRSRLHAVCASTLAFHARLPCSPAPR